MKLSISIATSLLAAVSLALPGPIQQSTRAAGSIQARDVPVWQANFTTASTSTSAGFRRVQYQYRGEASHTNYDPGVTPGDDKSIPVVAHPLLGRALQIRMNANQMRWEALPGGPKTTFRAGDDYYFRVDFALDAGFPAAQYKKFNIINQIHQSDNQRGSPPVEFNVLGGRLVARGSAPDTPADKVAYSEDLGPVQVGAGYKLVYRVRFGATAAQSLLQVWVNDQLVLGPYQPPIAFLAGGEDSYWKGATAYCNPDLSPFTVYQNAHRLGTSLASVS